MTLKKASAGLALDDMLNAAQAEFVSANPESSARIAKAEQVMPGGNTRSILYSLPFPLVMASGRNARLTDVDGHEYIDFIAEYSAGIYGHSHPVIVQAIIEALDGGINLSGHNTYEAALARLICERFASIDLVRFTNSGTEANLMAIAAAKIFTGRSKIVVFDGAYHGGVLNFGGSSSAVNVPHDYLIAPYNDLAAAQVLMKQHGSEIAAILVEPMLGAGGCIPGTQEFLQGLRAAADASGAVLIFDEVMTSRCAPGGRQEIMGIAPDITTLGKYIGGGMSFGAFGGRRAIMDQFDPSRSKSVSHAGTFNNNVVTMAAGIAGIGKLYTPEVAIAFTQRGNALRERLNRICIAHAVAMQFTGIGTTMNVHFTRQAISSPADIAGADPRFKKLLFFYLLRSGIYIGSRGFIVMSLPLSDSDLDKLVDAIGQFIVCYKQYLSA
ncbi:glutamate-1-semialdehyde 2,1-aminomutase [Collimonas sp. PA-H2]|uniref:aspartate aminotransferase family protein n=1 Tax=Collimonas sp. PA-H2 TaxID=1881062 RepID=UPI000C01A402|nr:aspartate aminotransferase family protein [Collimonas sp. PA-H2]PFH09043.1 glutamate-1-semialdehyde 2,1-aminomutase [Collimonas sp. PA-H2]